MDKEYFKDLVLELCKQPESEWLEFKKSWNEPDKIGELISGIANSTLLKGKNYGYVVWGVGDSSQNLVGTKFNPFKEKGKGNEELIPWLKRQISPSLDFEFFRNEIDEKQIVLLRVPAAESMPIQFKEYRRIRLGSYQKKLTDFPEKEKSSQISILIAASLEEGKIKSFGLGKRRKDAKYLPWWAESPITN